MTSVKFIGAVYLLKTVLPVLSTVSRCFHGGVVSFAKINPTLAAAKENLTAVSTSMEHIKELEMDLKPDGRLCMVNLNANGETPPTPSQRQLLESLTVSYIQALNKTIQQHFREASPILKWKELFVVNQYCIICKLRIFPAVQ